MFQWRNMMEFFLIKHFRRCLPLLLKYDAVGASRPRELGFQTLCCPLPCCDVLERQALGIKPNFAAASVWSGMTLEPNPLRDVGSRRLIRNDAAAAYSKG